MSKLDRMLGHYRRYHKPELTKKVVDAGGEIVLCRYFDVAGMMPWLVLNRFFRMTTFSSALILVNDKIVVPASRFVEKRLTTPFGKNFVLVAQKPLRSNI